MSLCLSRRRLLVLRGSVLTLVRRWLSPQQTAAALRPLYFVVHPDLFGQFPRERTTNEQSLKRLSEYISSLVKLGRAPPTELTFYLRNPTAASQEKFPCVKVALNASSVRATVTQVLETCRLSLDFLKTIPPGTAQSFPRGIKWHPSFYTATGQPDPEPPKPPPPRVGLTLLSWLSRHRSEVEVAEAGAKATMADIGQMREGLLQTLGVRDVRWDCVWSINYFRSSLLRFRRLFQEHPAEFRQVLEGRTLVFGNNTGVSALGEVVLSCDDVPDTWMRLLGCVRAYDTVLARLPLMEAEVSRLLNNMALCQHRRHHLAVMARDYELFLNRLLNSLRRCRGLSQELLGTEDLGHLQLVVEDESGPLMLTPRGQILVPASLPGSLVLDFIAKHKGEAAILLEQNASYEHQQEALSARCQEDLELADLEQDQSVSSREMVECCQRLLDAHWSLAFLLKDVRLLVSTYYSVTYDGQVVIPWNWREEDSGHL